VNELEIKLKSTALKNGETIAYRERSGGNKKLILVHGNMTSSKHWDLFMENIDEKYKLYAIDMRGFGASSYHKSIDSLHDFAKDLNLFVEKLNLTQFSLMGWSTGGGVVMDYAADHPDQVEKLILMESVGTRGYPIYKKDEDGQPIVDDLLKTKQEIANDPVQVKPVLTAYENKDKKTMKMIWNAAIYTNNQPDPAHFDEYCEDMFTQRNLVDVDYALAHFNISDEHNGLEAGNNKATRIELPVLVLWGENDKVVSEKMQQDIVKDIGENAELVYLKNSGHSPIIDNLDQLLEKVTDFLEK